MKITFHLSSGAKLVYDNINKFEHTRDNRTGKITSYSIKWNEGTNDRPLYIDHEEIVAIEREGD